MAIPVPTYFIRLVIGPQLVGSHAATALWGMSCLQVYSFFKHSGNQTLLHRSTVTALAVLNTLNTVLTIHVPFYPLVNQYGNISAIAILSWSFATFCITSEISNFIIRLLLARSVWLVSGRNIWVSSWIVVTSLYTLGVTAALGILFFMNPDSLALEISQDSIYRTERRLVVTSFAGSFVANTSVAIALCYYLYIAKTPFSQTQSLVKVLIRYMISTGLIVSIFSLIQMILHLTLPLTGIWMCFSFLVSKLYFNSYLAMLNSRDDMRGRADDPGPSMQNVDLPSISSRFPDQVSATTKTPDESEMSPQILTERRKSL